MLNTEENAEYIRCRNCGSYIEKNQSISGVFCSEKCAEVFTRCPNCGSFFSAINKDLHNGFCSIDCEAVYGEDGIIISKETESPDNSRPNGENVLEE